MNAVQALTLRNYLEHVYYRDQLDLKPNSAYQLKVAVSMMDRWHGKPVLLSELSPELIADWLRSLRDSNRSPRTINGRRGAIITIWRHAAKKRLAPRFDVDDVPRLKMPRRLPTAWSVEELRRLLPEIRRPWLRTFVTVLYETGCRLNSGVLLSWADWNPSSRLMRLPVETAKTGIEQRVKVSIKTADALDLMRPLIWTATERIFPCGPDNRPMWRELKRALKAAGLPHTRRDLFQKLRRTNATLTAVASSIEVAQRQLGHTSARQTIAAYIDPTFLPQIHAADVLPPI